MNGVTRFGDVLVAVGSIADEGSAGVDAHAAAWLSTDHGLTWRLVGADAFADAPDIILDAVAYTATALVAVGRVSDEQPWHSVAWISVDGLAWERIEMPGVEAWARSIADGAGGLVAVGGFHGPLVVGGPPIPSTMLSWRSPAAVQ